MGADDGNTVGNPNSVNTWDNGYPNGGNYWSNYGAIYQSINHHNVTAIDGFRNKRHAICNRRKKCRPLSTNSAI